MKGCSSHNSLNGAFLEKIKFDIISGMGYRYFKKFKTNSSNDSLSGKYIWQRWKMETLHCRRDAKAEITNTDDEKTASLWCRGKVLGKMHDDKKLLEMNNNKIGRVRVVI